MKLVRRNHTAYPTLPNLVDEFFGKGWLDQVERQNWNGGRSYPAVNIRENDKGFELELAAPGVRKEDFNLKLENDVLTISAERKEEKKDENTEGYVRREFTFQSFSRAFTLPKGKVQEGKIDASFENGVLTVTLPKKKEAQPKAPRRIEVG